MTPNDIVYETELEAQGDRARETRIDRSVMVRLSETAETEVL